MLIRNAAIAAGSMLVLAASADAPQAGDMSLSIWGGYLYTDGPNVSGHLDTTPPAAVRTLEVEHVGFGGASIGFGLGNLGWGLERAELYFDAMATEEDETIDTVGSLRPVTGGIPASTSGVPVAKSTLERERYEFGVNLLLPGLGGILPVDVIVTPFGGFADEDVFRQVDSIGTQQDTADVEWYFAGAMVGAEHTVDMGNGFSVTARGAGGIYYYDAEGDFASTGTTVSALTDRDSGVGFRGQASLGLNFALSESVVASLFGALDYWSDMPFAKTQVPNQPGVPASVGNDDAIDLRAGVKLTLHLD